MNKVKLRFRDKQKLEPHMKIFSNDPLIDVCEKKFKRQYDNIRDLKKHLEQYTCQMKDLIITMETINDTFNDLYEHTWEGHVLFSQANRESIKSWEIYLEEFKMNILRNVEYYLKEFPDKKKAIDQRNKCAVEYNKQRYYFESVSKSKKMEGTKITKMQTELETAKKKYEVENEGLKTELPDFIDNRIHRYIHIWDTMLLLEDHLYQRLLREKGKQKKVLDSLKELADSPDISVRNDTFEASTNLMSSKYFTQSTFSLLSNSTGGLDNRDSPRGGLTNPDVIDGTSTSHNNGLYRWHEKARVNGAPQIGGSVWDLSRTSFTEEIEPQYQAGNKDGNVSKDSTLSRTKSYNVNSKQPGIIDATTKSSNDPKPPPPPPPDINGNLEVNLKKKISFNRNTRKVPTQTSGVTTLSASKTKPNKKEIPAPLQVSGDTSDVDTGDDVIMKQVTTPKTAPYDSQFKIDSELDDTYVALESGESDMKSRPISYHPDVQYKSTSGIQCYYQVIAKYRYKAQDDDELNLEKDDLILVLPWESEDQMEDGWLYGENIVTKRKGLFPENHTVPTR